MFELILIILSLAFAVGIVYLRTPSDFDKQLRNIDLETIKPEHISPGDLVRLKGQKGSPTMTMGISVGDAYYCNWWDVIDQTFKLECFYPCQLERVEEREENAQSR